MSRDDKNMTKLAAALLLGAAPFSAAWCAEGGSWDWVIAPYLRAPAIGSDLHIDVPPINSGGTTQFSDLVGNLGFTVPFHLEGQGEEWGLFSNLLYLPLSDKRERDLFAADTSFETGIFELAGVWSPGERRHAGFEDFAGLRYLWAKVDLKIYPVDPTQSASRVSCAATVRSAAPTTPTAPVATSNTQPVTAHGCSAIAT